MASSSPVATQPTCSATDGSGHATSTGSARKTLAVSCTMAMHRRMHLPQKHRSMSTAAVATVERTAPSW